MKISPEIERYYSEFKAEPDRLDRHSLEKLRTQDILSRYLPDPPAKILDVGGAAGVYAFWLCERGYQVHLVDPVPFHIQEARTRAEEHRQKPVSISLGEAGHLNYPDNSFDAVLMLGPLYHLQDYAARVEALKEAKRVVKQNGNVISAFISRFAAMIDGYFKNVQMEPELIPLMADELRTGRHQNPTGERQYFTTAYFHHPDEIGLEIEASGLVPVKIIAVESILQYVPDLETKIQDSTYRQIMLDSLRSVEEDKSLLGTSSHILGIGRKP